jgi:hypothetical protein
MNQFVKTAQDVKKELISNGETCQWISAAAPIVPDASKPWITTNGEPTTTGVSILFKLSPSNPWLQLLKGSDVATGGVKALMHVVDFVPSPSDTVTRADGSKLEIQSITPFTAGGTIIFYYLEFKR